MTIDPASQPRTRVFLSYSRHDAKLATWLRDELEARQIEVFRDLDDTLPGEEWWTRLTNLITSAHSIVFILSAHSAASAVCRREVEFAQSLGKRLFPAVVEGIDWASAPPGLAARHAVSFIEEERRADGIEPLAAALLTDIDWVREHTRLYERAVAWQLSGLKGELLSGPALQHAEQWLSTRPDGVEPPTALHVEFVRASRAAVTAAERFRRRLILGLVAGYSLVITIGLVGFATQTANLTQSQALAIAEAAQQANHAGRYDTAALLALSALPPRTGAVLAPVPAARTQLVRAQMQNHLLRVVRSPHSTTVISFAAHPTEDRLLTLGADDRAFIYDWHDPSVAHELDLGADRAASGAVAFNADGSRAAVSVGASVRLFDTETGKLAQVVPFPVRVVAVDFDPRSGRIAAAGIDNTAFVVDPDTGRTVRSPPHQRSVQALSFSPDGKTVLSGSYAGSLIEWDAGDGRLIIGRENQGTVTSIGRIPPLFWYSTENSSRHAMHIWTPGNNDPIIRLPTGTNHTHSAAFHLGTSFVATAHWDNTARLISVPDGKLAAVLQHDEWLRGIAYSRDGREIVTMDNRAQLKIWRNPTLSIEPMLMQNSGQGPGGFAVASDGTFALSAGFDGEVVRLDLVSRKYTPLFKDEACPQRPPTTERQCWVEMIELLPGNRIAVFMREDKLWQLRSLEDGAVLLAADPGQPRPRTIAVSPDGRLIALGFGDGRIQILSVATKAVVSETRLPSNVGVNAMAFNPMATRIAIAANVSTLLFWELNSGASVTAKSSWQHGRVLMSVAWSPDGKYIATAGADGRAAYGLADADSPQLLPLTRQGIVRIRFSPDSRMLLTNDGNVRAVIWDLSSAQPLAVHAVDGEDSNSGIFVLAMTESPRSLLYKTTNGRVGRIRLESPPHDAAGACDALPEGRRGFTDGEMQEYAYLSLTTKFPCERLGLLAFWRGWMGRRDRDR